MPLDSIADLERRIRRLEMELDQYKHKFVAPDRTVKTEPPLAHIDHGSLAGLGDDDHPQYRKVADTIDHGTLTGLGDNDHPQYLLTTGKAADSDKLDGIDSTGFVNTTAAQTVGGTKTFSSIPVLPATDPTTANQAVRKGYTDASYLPISGKAADSDKLDGVDITAFLGLNSLTDPGADRVLFWDDSAGLLNWLSLGTGLAITGTEIKPTQPQFHPLSSPLTSTAWNGDPRSTVGTSTLIDLSTVFGVPAGVKAVLLRINIKETGTPGTYHFHCGPGSGYWYCLGVYAQAANVENSITGIVPCNADGDIYYRIAASGSNTMTVHLQIWGYWL